MKRRTFLLSSAAALTGVGGYNLYAALNGRAPLPGTSLIEPGAAFAQTGAEEMIDLSLVEEMEIGNPDAAVTIIEFSSFTCPHCARFNQTVYGDLKAAYVDTGLVRYIKREVYFDAYGLWAALVARCGGQAGYFDITAMLYAEQSIWARGDDTAAVAASLRDIGLRAGLTTEQLEVCFTDRPLAMAMIQTYQTNAEEFNVRSTPSFVINGETYSNMSLAEFQAILDPLLAETEG